MISRPNVNTKKVVRWLNRNMLDRFQLRVVDTVRESNRAEFQRYEFQEECEKHIERIKDHTIPLTFPRLATLYGQVRYLENNGIDGDFVECGVWRGGAAGMMALSQMDSGCPPRQFHLFDSFEGLPRATDKGDERTISGLGLQTEGPDIEVSGHLAVDDTWVRSLFKDIAYPDSHTHIHMGWFQDTLPKFAAGKLKIALLRLDGDLYESTRLSLEHLWDLLVPHGVMVIDDYLSFGGCKVAIDELMETLPVKPYLNKIHGYGGRYLIKPA